VTSLPTASGTLATLSPNVNCGWVGLSVRVGRAGDVRCPVEAPQPAAS
jgi:hypothetical protein